MFEIEKITVDGVESGAVIDAFAPYFAFTLSSDKNGTCLRRAEVALSNGWKKEIYDEAGVSYDGERLQPYSEYTLTIVAESRSGDKATASTTFATAKCKEGFVGKWITDGAYKFKEKHVSPKVMTFKTTFELLKEVKRATVYSTALGIYALFLNSERVGDDYFAPGFTSYKKNLQYQAYDITDKLKKENEMLAFVAGGWAVGKFTYCKRKY